VPRSKGIPSYCLHRPTGQARVRIDGRDVYLGTHGSDKSKRKYEEVVRKLISDRAADELKARVEVASDLTIHELVASYLKFARTYYVKDGRQTTEYGVITATLKLLKERHGFELVTEFGPLKLLALRDQWAADGIVRRQVNHRMERVRRMFSWGVSRQLVPPDTLEALKRVEGLRKGHCAATEGRKVQPVSEADVNAVLPHLNRQVRAMVELQRHSAMRPMEVTLMRGADLDTTGDVWVYRPHRHKVEHHDQDRVVHLGPKAIEVLRPWLRPDPSEYVFSPMEAMAEFADERRRARKTRVQPSQQHRKVKRPRKQPGERYTTGSYRQAIFKACDKAGVPRWRPNQLRHAAATRIRSEFGLETTRAILGHAGITATQIYAEQDLEAAREAMARLG
jgi:integrase